jgi:hypothetical protein
MKKNYLESFCRNIVRPEFQVVMLLITASIVIFMGGMAMRRFQPFEQAPDMESITPEKIRQWGGDPVAVEVGIYISNWHQFKIVGNEFIFDGVVWFQFDPALISLDTISKFSFLKGELIQKSAPSTKLIDGKLFAEYKIRLKFATTLTHRFFPLDDHRIFIALVNTHVTPSEVIFRSFKSDFETSKRIQIPAWYQVDKGVQVGYAQENFDKFDERKSVRYPQVIFILDFARSGVSLILLIFLPIFLIFFLSLFWFTFEPVERGSIMALTTSAITSLIAYRFVIQNMAPKVGYFLLSDHIFTFFLALAFFSFVLALLWVRRGAMTPGMITARGLVFILFHILFILMWYFLLFMWI